MKLGRRANILLLISLPGIAFAVGIVLGMFIRSSSRSSSTPRSSTNAGYDSVYEQYRFAAVTSDTNICSRIGRFDDITCMLWLSASRERRPLCLVVYKIMFLTFFFRRNFSGVVQSPFLKLFHTLSFRCQCGMSYFGTFGWPLKLMRGKN